MMRDDNDHTSLFSRILSGEIPEDLTEPEAQEFINFKTDAASEIWQSHDGRQITFH